MNGERPDERAFVIWKSRVLVTSALDPAPVALQDSELEDARWFDVRELHALHAHIKTERPFFDTIARRLIDTWLAEQASTPSNP